mmetsp:Transcript_19114/g.39890  ORF Transcript_19114/g.39890 Transcript_19114/m.39890 type:complete len:270 (+) Transcript_19114:108-917(+)
MIPVSVDMYRLVASVLFLLITTVADSGASSDDTTPYGTTASAGATVGSARRAAAIAQFDAAAVARHWGTQLRPFKLPVEVPNPDETGTLIYTLAVDPAQDDWGMDADTLELLESHGQIQAIHDVIESRLDARKDACYEHPVWDDIPLEATNSWVAALRSTWSRSRRGDVPMLCVLTAREEFPLLLNKMNLNGPWAELGVFQGQFSAYLLRHGNTSKLHLVDMWTEVDIYDQAFANKNLERTKVCCHAKISAWTGIVLGSTRQALGQRSG